MRVSVLVVMLTAGLAPALAWAGEPPCPRGWFGIRAMIVRIDPADGKVAMRAADGKLVDIAANRVVCQGETILFPPGSDAVKVELFEAGKIIHVKASDGPYTVKGGPIAVVNAAQAYVAIALEGVTSMGPPPSRPQPTGSRGGAASSADPGRQIQPILHLRNLPRQQITAGNKPIVGWREGASPYSCQTLSDDAVVLWARSDLDASWCEFEPDMHRAVRLVVREGRGRSIGWNVAVAPWPDVPRPEWIAPGAPVVFTTDRVAWAIWLWHKGGPQWRLQALGMLSAAEGSEWLAGYFLNGVLAETPLLSPQ